MKFRLRKLFMRLKMWFIWIRYLIVPKAILSKNIPSGITLSKYEMSLFLDPWYHDFKVLGIPTPQKSGIYGPNQTCKQDPIFNFINRAFEICREQNKSTITTELFCVDGFYANYAAKNGAEKVHGIDIDNFQLIKAKLMTKLLGNENKITFARQNVFELAGNYNFGICAGGLYHLSNPQDLLKSLRGKIYDVLLIQTVYSLENESEDYFETPAPHWTWGCRFSYSYLLKMVKEAEWKVVDSAINQATGNIRLEDKGYAYLLCVPEKKNNLLSQTLTK